MRDDPSEVERFLATIRPDELRSGRHLRMVAAARDASERAGEALAAAVESARLAGDPWTVIAVVLQTTANDARTRYGALVGEPPEEP